MKDTRGRTLFKNLKTPNRRQSHYENRPDAGNATTQGGYNRPPGASSSATKGNEAERLVRCRVCGFPCDLERDVNLKDGSYAGFGISLGAAQTMGVTVGDNKTPAAGAVSGTRQTYYNRTVTGGCPCCGSFIYNPRQRITKISDV